MLQIFILITMTKSKLSDVFLSLSIQVILQLLSIFPPIIMAYPSFSQFYPYNPLELSGTVAATNSSQGYETSIHFYFFLWFLWDQRNLFSSKWQSLLMLTLEHMLAHTNLWENVLTFSFTCISPVLVYLSISFQVRYFYSDISRTSQMIQQWNTENEICRNKSMHYNSIYKIKKWLLIFI